MDYMEKHRDYLYTSMLREIARLQRVNEQHNRDKRMIAYIIAGVIISLITVAIV